MVQLSILKSTVDHIEWPGGGLYASYIVVSTAFAWGCGCCDGLYVRYVGVVFALGGCGGCCGCDLGGGLGCGLAWGCGLGLGTDLGTGFCFCLLGLLDLEPILS